MENNQDIKRRFKITIEETTSVTKMKRGQYGVVEERLYSGEEIAKAMNPSFLVNMQSRDEQSADRKEIDSQTTTFPIKRIYDYQPETPTTVEVSTKIYEQTVDALNIQKVITAVNSQG